GSGRPAGRSGGSARGAGSGQHGRRAAAGAGRRHRTQQGRVDHHGLLAGPQRDAVRHQRGQAHGPGLQQQGVLGDLGAVGAGAGLPLPHRPADQRGHPERRAAGRRGHPRLRRPGVRLPDVREGQHRPPARDGAAPEAAWDQPGDGERDRRRDHPRPAELRPRLAAGHGDGRGALRAHGERPPLPAQHAVGGAQRAGPPGLRAAPGRAGDPGGVAEPRRARLRGAPAGAGHGAAARRHRAPRHALPRGRLRAGAAGPGRAPPGHARGGDPGERRRQAAGHPPRVQAGAPAPFDHGGGHGAAAQPALGQLLRRALLEGGGGQEHRAGELHARRGGVGQLLPPPGGGAVRASLAGGRVGPQQPEPHQRAGAGDGAALRGPGPVLQGLPRVAGRGRRPQGDDEADVQRHARGREPSRQDGIHPAGTLALGVREVGQRRADRLFDDLQRPQYIGGPRRAGIAGQPDGELPPV
ncbi:MAG: D-alanyl-D-alanine carboxypeptidase, partial [uncultured Gemmatimonadetes bacterium]